VDLAILVDQQGPDNQRILGLHARGCANERINRLERRDEPSVASRQLAKIPSLCRQLAIYAAIVARAPQTQRAFSAVDVLEPSSCLLQSAAGMGKRPRGELAEA